MPRLPASSTWRLCISPVSCGECQQIHAAWSWFSGLIFCLESSLFLASKYTICETLKVQDLLLGVGLMIFCLNSFFPLGSSLQMIFKWTHGKQNYSAFRTDTNLSFRLGQVSSFHKKRVTMFCFSFSLFSFFKAETFLGGLFHHRIYKYLQVFTPGSNYNLSLG